MGYKGLSFQFFSSLNYKLANAFCNIMPNYDVFNGDTDGIFAWHQLRLVYPRDATIVTGVKRDVNLASKVDANEGDLVTIMDVSHAKNRESMFKGYLILVL